VKYLKNDHMLSVGYNLSGQEFFDLCYIYKKYINDIFFSIATTMPGGKIEGKHVLSILKETYRYDLTLNLVLNRPELKKEEHVRNLEMALREIDIQRVSILDIKTARIISREFPFIEIDVSTHSHIRSVRELDKLPETVHAINISEPYLSDYSPDFFKAAHDRGIKLKYIANQSCVYHREDTLRKLFSKNFRCCKNRNNDTNRCAMFMKSQPWMRVMGISIYKEDLLFRDWIDIVKLSTRERTCNEILGMLKYWTSDDPTEIAYGIDIRPIDKYEKFLQIQKIKSVCSHLCTECIACKYMYDDITKI